MAMKVVNDYLPPEQIVQNGFYGDSEGRVFCVEAITPNHIRYRRVRKTGGMTKAVYAGAYGVSVFFVKVIKMPTPNGAIEVAAQFDGPWTRDAREVRYNGEPMFSFVKKDAMSPVALDKLVRKAVALLNLMERE